MASIITDNTTTKYLPERMREEALILKFVQRGCIDQSEVNSIILESRRTRQSLTDFLRQSLAIDAKVMAQVLADYLGLVWFDLSEISLDSLAKDLMDEQFIRHHRVLPLFVRDNQLYLAITEPGHLEIIGEIKFYTDLNIYPVVVEFDKLSRLIETYLSQQQYLTFSQHSSNSSPDNDRQIVGFVQQILFDAIQKEASDIHFEPYKTSYRIRLRVDGILHKVTQLSIDLANRITARLKIMSKLDISERRIPQDGRFTIQINSQESRDCRISTCPTLFGEKTVVRILDASKSSLCLDDLGLDPQQKALFLSTLRKPQGLMLVTGPTGSGKTITLYTALNVLNTLDKNISTAEDPVEIQLPGLNQVNVNSKVGLTFATILRAFLRQDPDVIMIGEIRDLETADIALKAAQTGHFVLSTLHTNSAAETLNRLLVMGVSNFNIVHSIQLIIAQRLIRKLCEYCKRMSSTSSALLGTDMNISDPHAVFYEAQGCDRCMKGYSGRIGVFEFMPVTSDIMGIIANNGNAFNIADSSRKLGMNNLQEAALKKLCCGITSLEEVRRVVL